MARAISTRQLDTAIGLTVLFTVVLGVTRGRASMDAGLVLVGLHGLVGLLFILRRAPQREGSWRQRGLCLLSVPMPMVAFSFAPSLDVWPPYALAVFALGACGAALSLGALGRSFGVLPAMRGVVTRGPFRIVRHPLYASELLMVVACAMARPDLTLVLTAMVTTLLVTLRIRIEEDVLQAEIEYGAYVSRVRYRLVPLLW